MSMAELPDELLILILVLLPVKSLLRFKCVSKHWASLIQSPEFVDYHRRRQTKNNNKLMCYRKDPTTETFVISAIDGHTLEKLDDLEWPPFVEEQGYEDFEPLYFPEDDGVPRRRINIFGPVNGGVYCIFRSLIDRWVGTLTLWNPATREYKHIHPQISFPFPYHLLGFKFDHYHQQKPEGLNVGFGYDHTTNDYKLVVVCQWVDAEMYGAGMDYRWHLRVYSLGSDTWRTVYFLNRVDDPLPLFEGLLPPFPLMEGDPPVSHCFLNGVFHWACTLCNSDSTHSSAVLGFDMATDALSLMKAPPPIMDCFLCYWSVWALEDTIVAISCMLDDPYSDHPLNDVDVWMMKEYGVDDSWVRLFKVQGLGCRWTCVGVSSSYDDDEQRVFFEDESGRLISADIVDEAHQLVQEHDVYGMTCSTHHGVRGSLGILDYVETLTRLNPL